MAHHGNLKESPVSALTNYPQIDFKETLLSSPPLFLLPVSMSCQYVMAISHVSMSCQHVMWVCMPGLYVVWILRIVYSVLCHVVCIQFILRNLFRKSTISVVVPRYFDGSSFTYCLYSVHVAYRVCIMYLAFSSTNQPFRQLRSATYCLLSMHFTYCVFGTRCT